MKKLILFLFLIPFFVGAQQQVINVGTGPNDHTGDPLRNAFIKTNSNFTELYGQIVISATAGGTNTYTASPTPSIESYVHGQKFLITFTNSNTGSSTLNISGQGAKTLKKFSAGSLVNLSSGDISSGSQLIVSYDGTNSILQIIGVGGSSGGGWSVTGTTNLTGNTVIDGDIHSTKFSYDNDAYDAVSQLYRRYDSTRLDPDDFYNYMSFRDSTTHTDNTMFIGNQPAAGGGQSQMYSQSKDASGNRKIGQWYAIPGSIFNFASDETVSPQGDMKFLIDGTLNATMLGNQALSATGQYSFAFGGGSVGVASSGNYSFGGGNGTSKQIILSGANAFGWYETNSSQTTGHGVLAANSAVLGGLNPNIPSNATGSIILGGSGIKATSAITNTTYTQNLRIGTLSYFGGFTTTATSTVHIAAGTSSVSPLGLTSGTDLTSAAAGKFEYNGTRLAFSPSTTRKRIPLSNDVSPTNGQILIGNGTDFTVASLTAGTGITLTPGSGSLTIDASLDNTLIKINAVAGGRNLTSTDNRAIEYTSNSSAINITIPTGLSIGFTTTVIQGSSGAAIVAGAGGTTIVGGVIGVATTANPGDKVEITCVATNTYVIKLISI